MAETQRQKIDRLETALALAAGRFDDLALIIERDGSYQNAGMMTASAKRCRQTINGKNFDDE